MTFTELFAARLGDLPADYSSDLVAANVVVWKNYSPPSVRKTRKLYEYLEDILGDLSGPHQIFVSLMRQFRWTMANGFLPEMLSTLDSILEELKDREAQIGIPVPFSTAYSQIEEQLFEILRMIDLDNQQPILAVVEDSFNVVVKDVLKNSLEADRELSKLFSLRNSLWLGNFSPGRLRLFHDELLSVCENQDVPLEWLSQNLTRFEELLGELEVDELWRVHTETKLGEGS